MNEIVKSILLVGDKFMPEMPLKQPGFTHSACGPYTKNKKLIEKFIQRQTGNADYIYKNDRFWSIWQLFQKMFILMFYMILFKNTITHFIKLLQWSL